MNKQTSAIYSPTNPPPPPWQLTSRWAGLIFALVGSASLTAPAQALNINFSYAPGVTLQQMLGFEIAGKVWQNTLADNVTVNLYIQTSNSLPNNVIGGSLPGLVANYDYGKYRNLLKADQTTANDARALNSTNAMGGGDYDAVIGGTTVKAIHGINLTSANAKAVGAIAPNNSGFDGTILLSNLAGQTVSWNYNFTGSTVPTGTLDLLSTAIHEIGHNLGFASAVDGPGLLALVQSGTVSATGSQLTNYANPLDLFRYTTYSTSKKAIDLNTGNSSYFSLDLGKTNLANFSNGVDSQASHWQQESSALGSLDPTLSAGERQLLSSLDVTALDVIGWDAQVNPINLLTLQDQAKQKLATKLGVSLDWLNTNLATETVATPDQSSALGAMIANSTIYPVGWASGGRSWQEGLWEYISKETLAEQGITPPSASPESVPEPSGLFGLLGVAGLGLLTCLSKKTIITE